MESGSRGDITQLLAAVRLGRADAAAELAERVFDNLRRIARGRLRHERPNHTLQPTALVNEVFMQLVSQNDMNWQNRAHFFGVAAQLMRRILIDYARTVKAQKRGGGMGRLESLDVDVPGQVVNIEEVLSVDEALKHLEKIDPRQSRVVELRYFAGMTEEEVAEVLQVSVRTVKRDWNMARSFLRDEMSRASAT
jgi:RNA polymerase sigma factor (TIGR02999 family)